MGEDFEVVEEYIQHGVRRFRVRYRKSNLIFNVRADNVDEALDKARRMAEKVRASRVLRDQP